MSATDTSTMLTREMIVHEARRWIGTPYLHQSSLMGTGCDCLGLVRGVWRNLVGEEPEVSGPYSPDWAEANGQDRLLAAASRHFTIVGDNSWQAGDIILFRWKSHLPAKHAGIATSRDSMVHAHDGASVCEVTIGKLWRRQIAGAFIFPGVASS